MMIQRSISALFFKYRASALKKSRYRLQFDETSQKIDKSAPKVLGGSTERPFCDLLRSEVRKTSGIVTEFAEYYCLHFKSKFCVYLLIKHVFQ